MTTLSAGHGSNEAQDWIARAQDEPGAGHHESDADGEVARAELVFAAEYLDDVERVRIATENRMRSMVADGLDATPYVGQVAAFQRIEHEATVGLERVVRRHPLGPWIKATVGVGAKQGARLVASIGDVAWNHLEKRQRRGPAELWSYCGLGDAAVQKRRKGVKSNWNPKAKMRAYLVAESCVKQRTSPYRVVYDKARMDKAGFLHDRPCQQCAGKGKPAEAAIGQPWRDGHAHAHGLRLVAKAVLRDLFVEARRVGA